jgi:hypothetical protein
LTPRRTDREDSGRSVVSKDGKTITTTAKGTEAEGKAMTLTLVYDKR